jgi:hypothetical protein
VSSELTRHHEKKGKVQRNGTRETLDYWVEKAEGRGHTPQIPKGQRERPIFIIGGERVIMKDYSLLIQQFSDD